MMEDFCGGPGLYGTGKKRNKLSELWLPALLWNHRRNRSRALVSQHAERLQRRPRGDGDSYGGRARRRRGEPVLDHVARDLLSCRQDERKVGQRRISRVQQLHLDAIVSA